MVATKLLASARLATRAGEEILSINLRGGRYEPIESEWTLCPPSAGKLSGARGRRAGHPRP